MLVNYLAELLGIAIVISSLALIINPKYIKILFAEIDDDKAMFYRGIVTMVIGVAMILAYNEWVKNWQVIITIFGWLALIKGLVILFIPEIIRKWIKKIENASFLPFALIVALIIGLVITYFGFTTA